MEESLSTQCEDLTHDWKWWRWKAGRDPASEDEVVAFVMANKGKILHGLVNNYCRNTPLDEEDFIQEACLVGIEVFREFSCDIYREKGVNYAQVFWVRLKRKLLKDLSVRAIPCGFIEDYAEDELQDSLATGHVGNVALVDPLSRHDEEVVNTEWVYQDLCRIMTDSEKNIMWHILGLDAKGGSGVKETARRLGCTPKNVRLAVQRVVNRIEKKGGVLEAKKLSQTISGYVRAA
ncbi:hypothetical protein [Geoalkalibacter halelectricus]|uniref:hypothetical protein n=1 Tax=Geoalkalibacter halelectricus TaxID=2847045 RepID=UPI00266EE441|nr:hypothetical protein [Geoalkalibacter halelectricus]MDO3380368.1 hypothetical protein [Geoalkalibacter halelectricus]